MNLLIFSSCVPLFTALTGGIMVFFAWRYSMDSHERMLNRRLLLYLLALTGTWTGLFLYLALPEVFQTFFPVYCLSTLAVPVYLYAYILALVRNQKEKSLLWHGVTLCLSAVVIAGLPYFPVIGWRIVAVTVLPLARFTFSGMYFGLSVYVLWYYYRKEQSYEKVRLIPARWVLIFMVLTLIQFINSLIAVLVADHVQSGLVPMAVASVMISLQMGILLYNTICRNFELFRVSTRLIQPEILKKRKRAKIEKQATENVETRIFPFSKRQFEQLFFGNKLFLNPHLTLAELAERLETNRSYVSNFINHEYGMNFNRYLNACRLKELNRLKRLRSNVGKKNRILIEKAGFNSYQNYLRAKGGRKDEQ